MGKMQKLAVALVLFTSGYAYADVVDTSSAVRPDNALLVDIQVRTSGTATQVFVTYQAVGVDTLVSRLTPVSPKGLTTVTIGRLRADMTYTYRVEAIDSHGRPAGNADGTFTTGSLPTPLSQNSYVLRGRSTVPLVILAQIGTFRGFVALDLQSKDGPQIVWYYSNPPSNASGTQQIDSPINIVQAPGGKMLFADTGSGGPVAADSFYREITPDGTLVRESPPGCVSLTPPIATAQPQWIWGQGNDIHEELPPGSHGSKGSVLHLGKIVKDPFFDAGLSPQGARLQLGSAIRRWNPVMGTDDLVWDPFNFMDPLTERTDATTSDPGINSNTRATMACAGSSLPVEEWTHANSLQIAPTGEILQSIRHLDTVIAISPRFDAINWRIGRFSSSFGFPNPSDKFYHQHFVRMLPNGHLLLFDNGNGRPMTEGGQYSRGLELELDWDSMTATKVWEYRHPVSNPEGATVFKYSNSQGMAQRMENGNTFVLFGSDIDPVTLTAKNPQTFTLVEADSSPEAKAIAVLDIKVPGDPILYRVLPITAIFGESPVQPSR